MKKTLFIIGLALIATFLIQDDDYIEIPSTSIRMRVIAKSNDTKDQEDKIKIKKALEEKIYEITEKAESFEETDLLIKENKTQIDEYIRKTIAKNGIKANFSSNYGVNYFPEKVFKGITYSAGNYKSFVVTLDEGKGDNWWCVLYPPLCLIDENVEEYEYHSLIKDTLAKYN